MAYLSRSLDASAFKGEVAVSEMHVQRVLETEGDGALLPYARLAAALHAKRKILISVNL